MVNRTGPVSGPEGRLAPRFPVDLPVEFDGGVGVTRDLGASGVFFTCERGLTPGSRIDFTIVLDGLNQNRPLRLRCSGEVVRVETSGSTVGIAAKIEEYTIKT